MVAVLNVGQYGHWNDPQTQHKFWLNKLSVVYNVVLWRPESKQTDFSYHRYQVIKDMNARKDAYAIYSWRLLHDLLFHKFMLYTTFAKLTTDWNLVVTGKDLPIITLSSIHWFLLSVHWIVLQIPCTIQQGTAPFTNISLFIGRLVSGEWFWTSPGS